MKLGIIGLGRRMSGVLELLRKFDPELEVTALVDTNPEGARQRLTEKERESVRFYDSVEALVRGASPDALAIGTRCDTHTDFAVAASKFPLPLFLEKPVSNSIEQALRLEAAYERSQSPVVVGFPLRVSTLAQRAGQLLKGGAVGRIEHVLAVNYVSYGNVYFDTWHRDYSVTQGLFLQKATHDFDYLSHLVGAPIVRVAAMHSLGRVYRDKSTLTQKPDPFSYYHEGIGTPESGMNEDASSALLEFANGAQGVYTQVFYSKRAPRRGATFSGHSGLLEFDWYANKITTHHHHAPFDDVSQGSGDDGHFGGDSALAKNFVAVVKEGAASIAPISGGLESVYACLAAKESAESGRFVSVRQLGGC